MARVASLAALLLAVAALCAGAARGDEPPRPGLNVGTVPNPFDGTETGTDVVRNGTQKSWTVAAPYEVNTIVNYVDLFLSLEPAEGLNSSIEVDVIWTTDDTFGLELFLEGEQLEQNQAVRFRTGYQNQKRLHAVIECANRTKVGHADVELQVAAFRSVPMTFTYNCTNALNFSYDFFVSTSGDVGHGMNLIEHGRTVGTAETITVDEDTDEFSVWTFLDSFAPHGRTEDFFVACDWDDVLIKEVTPPPKGTATEAGRSEVPIKFECNEDYHVNDSASSLVTVTFIFDRDGVEDATFSFVKECSYLPSPEGGGWSPFGVFCFTVFIIILVFCVAGCGVNRFHFHKQGADIIPGMPLYRKCLGRGEQRVYTPQADFAESSTVDGAYGSYQTQL